MKNEEQDLGSLAATEDSTAFANPAPDAASHAGSGGWLPIDTHPKGGDWFVGGMVHPSWGWVWGRCRWQADRSDNENGGYFHGDGIRPTHWAPLPSPPASATMLKERAK